MENISELVTVIIPTYKDHEGLNKALRSVVNQTYKDLEVIVVNDYPEEQIENYIEVEDDRIKSIDCEVNHGGAGEGARNVGIENSNGKYLTFLDDDDEIKPDTIEKQIDKLKEKQKEDPEYKAVTIWGEIRQPNGKVKYAEYPEKEGDILKETLTRNNIVPPGPLLEKEILEETGKYDEDVRIGDWDLSIRIAKNYKIAIVKEPLYIYYPKTAEEMQGIYSWRYKSHKRMMEKYWEDIKKYPEAKSNFYRLMALDHVYMEEREEHPRKYFKKTYRANKNLVNFTTLIISYLPIYCQRKIFTLMEKFKWKIKEILY